MEPLNLYEVSVKKADGSSGITARLVEAVDPDDAKERFAAAESVTLEFLARKGYTDWTVEEKEDG